MDPVRWKQVKDLYEAASARPVGEREAFLARAYMGDDDLRREVQRLLDQPLDTDALFDLVEGAPSVAGDDVRDLTGTRLGSFEVRALIGQGGMGEVYRAHDAKLGRDVAIKVLPSAFTADAGRLAGFEREARVLASLNHPHIAAIYGVEESEGVRGLVLELVEGETLADVLRRAEVSGRSRLRLQQVLGYARQIADALEAAHEKAITHRDLKPANVAITPDGVVKLLDFGIAKVVTGDGPGVDLSHGTVTSREATRAGVIAGTAGYMSPEQAQGKTVDKRTDIWAFGCVLYEMLARRKAFDGDTLSATIAAVLDRDPDWSMLPTDTPRRVRSVIQRCLEKDPKQRLRDIGDARLELEQVIRGGIDDASEGALEQVRSWRGRTRLAAAAAIVFASTTAGLAWFALFRDSTDAAARATSTAPPVRVARLTDFQGVEEYPAISPDGRSVAFTADEGGTRQIWVRLIAGGPPLQLTRDASDHVRPRWSPDSSSLIYFSSSADNELTGALWGTSALGGAPYRIVDSLTDGDISHDGTRLAFVRSSDGRLELVTADRDGGNPKVIVRLDGGYSYVSPRWSPDDTSIAYQRNRMSLDDEVFVVAAGGGEPRGITRANTRLSGFAWLPDGSGIIMSSSRGSTLYYLPSFNLWSVSLKGGAWRQDTFGEVSYLYPDVDRTGMLVTTRLQLRSDIWRYPVDFSGIENVRLGVRVTHQTGQVRTPTAGPGDKEVAYVSDSGGHANIWVTKLDTGESRQLTHERDPEISIGVPVWSPDGRQIAFASSRDAPKGQNGYWLVSPDGSGLRNLRLLAGWADWSGDGRWVYYSEDPHRQVVSKVSVDGGQPVAVRTDTSARPAISRDGSTLYWLVELLAGSGLADYEIRTATPESGSARTLARIPGRRVPIWLMMQPVVSPDGKWLALPLVDNGTSNIWVVSTADGTFRQLTDFGRRATLIARRVSWSSDGRSVFAALGEGEADVVLLAGVVSRGR
jgi:eukaryotic-like serine/threonine-protein kinase